MRYLMFTAYESNARREIHQYNDTELAEVFGDKVVALDTQGFFTATAGIWVDMERAAKKRTAQIRMAIDDAKPKSKSKPSKLYRVLTGNYVLSHGKQPRGYGHWAFFFGQYDEVDEAFWVEGSYGDAVKAAKQEAAKRGKINIYVGS